MSTMGKTCDSVAALHVLCTYLAIGLVIIVALLCTLHPKGRLSGPLVGHSYLGDVVSVVPIQAVAGIYSNPVTLSP